ncbi:MAG: hypothetical protein ABIL68_07955, partial [bacterium]
MGIIVGKFTLILPDFGLKMIVAFICGAAFTFLIVVSKFSKPLILLSLCISVVLFFDEHLLSVEHSGIANGITISLLDIFLFLLILRRLLFFDRNIDTLVGKERLFRPSRIMAVIVLVVFGLSLA